MRLRAVGNGLQLLSTHTLHRSAARATHSSAMAAGQGGPSPDLEAALLSGLTGTRDAYDGLLIDPGTIPSTSADFAAALQHLLPAWRQEGYRGVWLKLPISHAHHVGHAVDAGFQYHHAEADYLMLTHWLPETENKLPPNASHQVGVGAFVFDRRQRKMLVVQELSGPLKGSGVWKLPTGLVLAGEDVTEAAEREVLEETGARARFRAVLAMRQAHGFAFGKSDMFFVLALELEEGVQELVPQADEVSAVGWISVEEYCAQEFHASRPLLVKIMERCAAWVDGRYAGLSGNKLQAGFSGREDLLLFGDSVEALPSDAAGEGAISPREKSNEDAWIGLN